MSKHLDARRHSARMSVILLVIITACLASTSHAQDWVASTGTPDTASAGVVRFTGGNAGLTPFGPIKTQATIRYNVVSNLILPGQDLVPGECWQMVVRFLDNGPGADVTLRLKQYNLRTGTITTLMTFDSKSAPASNAFQMGKSPCTAFNWRFVDHAASPSVPAEFLNVYYVEATLTRSAVHGNPRLAGFGFLRIIP
jgi:hypothetical protein